MEQWFETFSIGETFTKKEAYSVLSDIIHF